MSEWSTYCVAEAFLGLAGDWGPPSQCVDISQVLQVGVGLVTYCAYYTDLTSNYRANTTSAANRSCLDNNHVDTSLTTAADVVGTISPCLTGYCEGSSACRAQKPFPCLQTNLVTDGATLNVDSVSSCIKQICASNPVPQADPDIAGIGLITSYILQTGIVFLIALSLLLLAIWPKTRSPPVDSSAQTRYRDEHLNQKSGSARNKTWHNRLSESLHQALIAFLVAQCFLALAMSIAALLNLDSPDSLGPFDQVALGSASGTIIIPTTFGLYILASFYRDSQSWYLFTLSLVAWILGYCITLGPQMMELNRLNKDSTSNVFTTSSQYPQVCNNIAPFKICGNLVQPDLHPEYAFYYTLCMPIMLGLVVWQLSSLPKKIGPNGFGETSKRLGQLILHLGAIGFFVGPCYVFFQSISDLLSYEAVNMNWDFGQIVAILTTSFSVVELVRTYLETGKHSHVRKSRPRFSVGEAPGSPHGGSRQDSMRSTYSAVRTDDRPADLKSPFRPTDQEVTVR